MENKLQKTEIYPCITLYQPWATWIMRGWKTIETRTHNKFKSLIGKEILIHAGNKTDGSDLTTKNKYLTPLQIAWRPDEMVNGYILGSAYVKDFRLLHPADAKEALIECFTIRYGLFLTKIREFDEPILCKGEMGIWYYDFENKHKVKKPNSTGQTSLL